jgi:hypothetical protein
MTNGERARPARTIAEFDGAIRALLGSPDQDAAWEELSRATCAQTEVLHAQGFSEVDSVATLVALARAATGTQTREVRVEMDRAIERMALACADAYRRFARVKATPTSG